MHDLQDLGTEEIEEAILDATRIVNAAGRWTKQQGMPKHQTVLSAIKPVSDVTSDAKASIMHYATNQKVTLKVTNVLNGILSGLGSMIALFNTPTSLRL